jgi:NAD(P)-dependent dehydrogenase (short-subunit alcohol dehydrogenase family)
MSAKAALIIGASRGLGWGLARELLREGWEVLGTVRSPRTRLHDLRAEYGRQVSIEDADVTRPEELARLRTKHADKRFDLLFVVAGISNNIHETIGEVTTEEFLRVVVTNALSPLRAVETLIDLVTAEGLVAVMSSELASITDNTDGGWDVYRASKASLNTLMRCLVARRVGELRTFYAVAPGWVRTDLGGKEAPLSIESSSRGVLAAMRARAGTRGLVFVDYKNEILPW